MPEQRWHPDRCSAPGNSKSVEESKKKFQAVQHAYSGNFTSPRFLIFQYLFAFYYSIVLFLENILHL